MSILSTDPPWYVAGLKFTCTQCGNCCSGPPGHVWITRDEIVRLAQHLKITPEETVERYCRKIGGQFSLIEQRNPQGQYDCIFLREESAPVSDKLVHTKRICGVYSARPEQCRAWPFWSGNLASEKNWQQAGERCPGMNRGRRYSLKQITAMASDRIIAQDRI